MSQDWTGNKATLFAALGASNHTDAERESHDYYATDPAALEALMKHKDLPPVVYECACGAGHLSRVLEAHGHKVYSTDLIDRGYGEGGIDFLQVQNVPKGCKCILTNPPYKYTGEFIAHAMDILPEGGEAIYLLNVNILAGKDRFRRFYSKGLLSDVYLFVKRIKCAKNGLFADSQSSAVNYAWFVFRKGYNGSTLLHWI